MDAFEVTLGRSAHKELDKLPNAILPAIMRALKVFADDPFPFGSIKLVGKDEGFRMRVGDYRIVYRVDLVARQVLVDRIRHRKDAYKRK